MIWIILLGGNGTGSFCSELGDKGNGAGRSQQRNLGICKCGIANNGLFFCSGYDYGYEGAFFY